VAPVAVNHAEHALSSIFSSTIQEPDVDPVIDGQKRCEDEEGGKSDVLEENELDTY